MGFYPDVSPGDAFKPSAALENDLRHMVNSYNGKSDPQSSTFSSTGIVDVCNFDKITIPKGYAVSFYGFKDSGDPWSEDLFPTFAPGQLSDDFGYFPVLKYNNLCRRWGVLLQDLAPNEIGRCAFFGPFRPDRISRYQDKYVSSFVKPDDETGELRFSGDGTGAPVLAGIQHISNMENDKNIIFLGMENNNAGSFIRAKNNTSETIPAHSFVTLTPDKDDYSVLYIAPGVSDPCGLVKVDCAPGDTCNVQISGVADCSSVHTEWPSGGSPNFLKVGRSMLLNSTGQSTYNNYFKVVATEYKNIPGNAGHVGGLAITKVKIIDGGDPSSGTAGPTDAGDVFSEELEHNFYPGTKIYLRLTIGDSGSLLHEFEINTYPPYDGREPVILLAEISEDNTVIQRWTGGEIFWRERFVIPFSRRGQA